MDNSADLSHLREAYSDYLSIHVSLIFKHITFICHFSLFCWPIIFTCWFILVPVTFTSRFILLNCHIHISLYFLDLPLLHAALFSWAVTFTCCIIFLTCHFHISLCSFCLSLYMSLNSLPCHFHVTLLLSVTFICRFILVTCHFHVSTKFYLNP